MAGPLTVTSLPLRTSPVKRGAWLLETLLNRPPTEPKVAFSLDDKPGEADRAATVRQRFELHRNNPACYTCHSRLDPPGFALEAYDPIGTFRERDGDQPVDATGSWEGRAFDGPAEFKAAMLARPDDLVRGFAEHLLSYALARPLEVYDMPAVDEIVRACREDGYRFQRVIVGVIDSYPFRHVRNVVPDEDVP